MSQLLVETSAHSRSCTQNNSVLLRAAKLCTNLASKSPHRRHCGRTMFQYRYKQISGPLHRLGSKISPYPLTFGAQRLSISTSEETIKCSYLPSKLSPAAVTARRQNGLHRRMNSPACHGILHNDCTCVHAENKLFSDSLSQR